MKNLLVFLLVLTFAGACSPINQTVDDETNVLSETNTETKVENTEEKRDSIMDFGQEFQPPHYQIDEFIIKTSKDQKVRFEIDYTIDQSLYKFLAIEKPEYYFFIEYPENTEIFEEKKTTNYVKGQVIGDNTTEMNYKIVFEESLKDLTESEKKELNTVFEGYKLIITNKDKYPIHIIDDIYHYTSYDPDLSQTIDSN